MEGLVFRQLSDNDILPCIQVLVCSSLEDKKLLVEKLRAYSKIVCITGDGTDDDPAPKTIQVGAVCQ